MVFSSYEELMGAVEERRKDLLTLEIDLGAKYSPEYEQAKAELHQAQQMKTVVDVQFLGGDVIPGLEARVAELRPEPRSVFIQYKKLDLDEWAAILRQQGGNAIDQYEKVLPKTFVGVFGEDPAPEEEDKPEGWVKPEPLTTNPLSVSTRGGAVTILPGGSLNSVVQNFMSWQNSGGDVTIRPTKSGRV